VNIANFAADRPCWTPTLTAGLAGDDPEILRGWIARSVSVTSAAEIFEAE